MADNEHSGAQTDSPQTLALSTTLEEDFIAPLTATHGALEILRDFPDLDAASRQKFIIQALQGCARLKQSVEHLGRSVYAAGRRGTAKAEDEPDGGDIAARIGTDEQTEIFDLDLSDFTFDSAETVNRVFDVVDDTVLRSGRKWYFLINQRHSLVWPEAWVAYAHRTKKVRVNFTLGTVRYAEPDEDGAPREQRAGDDPTILPSRAAALALIETMKAGGTSGTA
jgi:hypothetical protein